MKLGRFGVFYNDYANTFETNILNASNALSALTLAKTPDGIYA